MTGRWAGRGLAVAVVVAVTAGGHCDAARAAGPAWVTDPAALVDPLIGTGGPLGAMGNVFPGADLPFGMAQPGPDTPSRPSGGGYYYGDHAITGFSLTHMSGPECRAAGDVLVLPVTGGARLSAVAGFSHEAEHAEPGYYRVRLTDGIDARLTATTRTAMLWLAFPPGSRPGLVIKLTDGQNRDYRYGFAVDSPAQVSGFVTRNGFCGAAHPATLHFVMRFSSPLARHGSLRSGQHRGAYLGFGQRGLLVKTGLSYVSAANAAANLAAEDPGWSFGSVRAAAHRSWNALLGKIQVAGGDTARQTVFYTALYHALLHPNVFSDANGQYLTAAGTVRRASPGHAAFYTNFSGWDIYRGQAQLEALTDPGAASDTAQSMVDYDTAAGLLPKWLADGGETFVMSGDPADAIIAGYYAFGARHFSAAAALADMIAEATRPNPVRPGLGYLDRLGYLPADGRYGCCHAYGPAATTLEYDTADFALSRFAGALGDARARRYFAWRAQDWRHEANPASGFLQPRRADGSWDPGFSLYSTSQWIEGNSWKYSGDVPFNIAGLAAARGGTAVMAAYLDAALSGLRGGHRGRADLSNELSLALPWEYDFIGRPYRTQAVVRQIQDALWTAAPGGIPGNDDLGALSAWFAWSALGLYPEIPGSSDLALSAPLFAAARVRLPSGRTLTITASGSGPYIQAASWDGAPWDNAYAPVRALTAGGTLAIVLGPAPDPAWAAGPRHAAPSYGGNVAPPAGGTAAIRAGDGLCADAGDGTPGTKVRLAACAGSLGQYWRAGQDGTFRSAGLCLTATVAGQPATVAACDGGRGQRWPGKGRSAPGRGLCLASPGGPAPQLLLAVSSAAGLVCLAYQPVP